VAKNKNIRKETKKPKKKDVKGAHPISGEGESYNPAAVEVVRKPRKIEPD